jgi:hypothetical protein
MSRTALFPGLMRGDFAALHSQVQAVHSGTGGRWQGRASVQRGTHVLLRIAAAVAGLPISQRDAATVVTIEAIGDREIWTRQFGTAAPMRSTLSARSGLLVEQLGLITMQFQIVARDGGMIWDLRHIAFLGIPLPRRCLQVQAGAEPGGAGYRFFVAVRVPGLGDLISYEGELDVPG